MEPMLGFGFSQGNGAAPPKSAEQSNDHPDLAGPETPPTVLPRISFGPAADSVAQSQSSGGDNGRNAPDTEPELLSSDYLYDYVVLGFLDVLARQIRD
jgi:hypothetical protein